MKHIIWTNDLDYEDWRDDLESEYPDLTEEQRVDLMYEINDEYFSDEQVNLDKELGGRIIVYGTLGLWDGKKSVYKILKETNLNGIMTDVTENSTWYVEDGEVQRKDVHHDGTNYFTYRVLKGIDEYDFEEFIEDHSFKEGIEKYTEPLGHYVSEIYGW